MANSRIPSWFIAGIVVIILDYHAFSQETVKGTLSLRQAVTIALEHHPSLRAANAGVRSASAGLTQSLSPFWPSVIGSGGWTHNEGWFVFNPSFPPRNQIYSSYTAGLTVTQTIFDFGKTIGRVSASSDGLNAAESDFESARTTVIMNVELAYYVYIQAQQIVDVNEEAVQRTQQHLTQAKAFYGVGTRPQIDVTRAEVDHANAEVSLIRARNQLRIAKLQLENAMGIRTNEQYRLTDSLQVREFTMTIDSVKSLTLEQRPELAASRARLSAAQSLVTAAWTQYLPTISAAGAYNWTNFDFPLYNRWNAGLTISLPLFMGFSLTAQVDQARANADAAQANLDALAEAVVLETEQDYFGLKEAEERISASVKLVEQSEQTLNLAEKQYAAGVGTVLDVTDAQVLLSNARITKIQAIFDYNSSLIHLQRSMGMLGS